jgi:PKD repeat protein
VPTPTPNKPPIADFAYSPLNPRVFEFVFFNASVSYDPDGFIKSYTWDFGDGNTTQVLDSTIYHYYNAPGIFNVTLTVVDSGGLRNSTSKLITVTKPPIAVFTYSPPRPKAGQTVVFDASESKPDGGYITSYFWDFGDGVTENVSDPSVTHVYNAFGNYTVTLVVADSEGETAQCTETITIIAPPIADFSFYPSQPRARDVITFDASNSTPNGGFIIDFQWNFGDGSPIEFGVVVQHKYLKIGEYDITLNVTDSEGEWSIKEAVVKVLPHRADLNEDGRVDVLDLYVLCRAYGSYPGHKRWNAKADINDDEKVDILDVTIIAKAFYQDC